MSSASLAESQPVQTRAGSMPRIASIDVLRGIVIVLMALDHVRDYMTISHFNPVNPTRTDLALYTTRWITHLCAPIFLLLAGVSIRLQLAQFTRPALSLFLIKRGLWLIFLECTVVTFLWTFQLGYANGVGLQVIWAIGASMVIMAALVHLPAHFVGVLGVLLICGHNLTDSVVPETYGSLAPVWVALHAGGPLGNGQVVYPVLPWLGIMAAGYGLGAVFFWDAPRRYRALLLLGIALLALFTLLRSLNGYGDPHPWSAQNEALRSAFSFFNVNKYPPSLDYTSITLGFGLLAMALLERAHGAVAEFFRTYGKVPLFAYLVHIALAHTLAGTIGLVTGNGFAILGNPFWQFPPSWGFGLGGVYAAWLAVLLMLYPLCRWYGCLKGSGRYRWMAYL